jgi:hypothetical protein
MMRTSIAGFGSSQTVTAQGYSPGPAFSLTLGAALRSTLMPHESARIAPPTLPGQGAREGEPTGR